MSPGKSKTQLKVLFNSRFCDGMELANTPQSLPAYLSPLLHSVSPITNVTVTSQILPFSTLPMRPLKSTGLADHPFYFFRAEHLPHFINTAEWNLASTGTGSPLHFLLYIPKQNEYPLYILDSAKERVETNAWLVPGWGGAHVSNLPLEAAVQGNGTTMVASTFTFTREILRPIMGIFAAQLRGLLGVQAEIIEADPVARPATGLAPLPLVYAAPDPSRGLTDMEFDRLSRKRCARNVLDAARGLASLGKLVSGLPSMVVPDRIRVAVDGSLARLRDAIELSEKGDLDAAFAASADALELSEAAFFDPAAVSMLYFPDEHRYAVYMPFFVPVGVPLVVGLVAEIRRWRDRRRHAKEKGE